MSKSNDNLKYEDIIHLPHPTSRRHPRMSVYERAAQFSPFAALTGYDAAVKETARLTEQRIELDECEKNVLDERLQYLQKHLAEQPTVTVTYFKPDERKTGGQYLTVTGIVKKIDSHNRCVIFMDDTRIPLDEIIVFSIETGR